MQKYVIKLYVTGQTPRSLRAIANLRRICEEELSGAYELEICRSTFAEPHSGQATASAVRPTWDPTSSSKRWPHDSQQNS